MGTFRVEVEAVGGHGCQRDAKDGETVRGCGHGSCPDCITSKYISELARAGANVKAAKLVHWPGQPDEIVDEYIVDPPPVRRAARKRHGSFSAPPKPSTGSDG